QPIDLSRRAHVVRALSAAETVHPEHAGLDGVAARDERDIEASVRLVRKAHALADADAVVGESQSGVVDRHIVNKLTAASLVIAQEQVVTKSLEVELAHCHASVEEQVRRLRPAPCSLSDLMRLAIALIRFVLDGSRFELSGQLILEVPLPVVREH